MTESTIEVTNPFEADCEFEVSCWNSPRDDPAADAAFEAAARGATTKGKDAFPKLDPDAALPALPAIRRTDYPGAFGTDRAIRRVRAGETAKVRVFFLPFAPGAHAGRLAFEDADRGRFVVALLGKAGSPAPCASIRAEVPVQRRTFDVAVDGENNRLEAAKRAFLEKHPGRNDRMEAAKARTAGDAWPSVVPYVSVSRGGAYVDVDAMVEIVRDPNSSAGPPSGNETSLAARSSTRAGKPMKLNLKFRDEGTYFGTVVLGSTRDVRVFEFEFVAGARGGGDAAAPLEFTCRARGCATLEIPVVRGGESASSVEAAVTGPDATSFRVVRTDTSASAKGRRETIAVTFSPRRTGTFRAALTLRPGAETRRVGTPDA